MVHALQPGHRWTQRILSSQALPFGYGTIKIMGTGEKESSLGVKRLDS